MERKPNNIKQKIKNGLSIVGVMLLAAGTFADRSVTLFYNSYSGGDLKIANPSAEVVVFDLACFNSSGSSTLAATSLSINPNSTMSLGGSSGTYCPVTSSSYAYGSYMNGTSSSGSFTSCGLNGSSNYYNTVSSATNVCPVFYHVCTLEELGSFYGSSSSFVGWIGYGSFDTSTDYGSSWSTSQTTGYAYISGYGGSSTCRYNPTSGSSRTFSGCTIATSASGTSANTVGCCGSSTYLSGDNTCKVTVKDATSANGYLISPQFKGNTPF